MAQTNSLCSSEYYFSLVMFRPTRFGNNLPIINVCMSHCARRQTLQANPLLKLLHILNLNPAYQILDILLQRVINN